MIIHFKCDNTHRWFARFIFFDGYCSTVQGLLDWFEVDLGFNELSFIQMWQYPAMIRTWHGSFVRDKTHSYVHIRESFVADCKYVMAHAVLCAVTYLQNVCTNHLRRRCQRVVAHMNESIGINKSTDGGARTWNNYDSQNIQQVFTGVLVHIECVFTGVPKISNKSSVEWVESLSLERSIRKTDRSGDPNIL